MNQMRPVAKRDNLMHFQSSRSCYIRVVVWDLMTEFYCMIRKKNYLGCKKVKTLNSRWKKVYLLIFLKPHYTLGPPAWLSKDKRNGERGRLLMVRSKMVKPLNRGIPPLNVHCMRYFEIRICRDESLIVRNIARNSEITVTRQRHCPVGRLAIFRCRPNVKRASKNGYRE